MHEKPDSDDEFISVNRKEFPKFVFDTVSLVLNSQKEPLISVDHLQEKDFHDWHNEQIRNNAAERNRLQDSANAPTDKLSDHLITTASALIVVITGFLFVKSSDLTLSPLQKVAIIIMMGLFVGSICVGLYNLEITRRFWKRILFHNKAEATMLNERQYAFKDYSGLRRRMQEHRDKTPLENRPWAIRTQVITYVLGMLLLFFIFIFKILSLSPIQPSLQMHRSVHTYWHRQASSENSHW